MYKSVQKIVIFLIIFLVFVAGQAVYCQSSFVFKYSTLSDEISFDAVETSDGGFIVAAKTGTFSPNAYSTLLLKLDPAGDTSKTLQLSNSSGNCLISSLLKSSDGNFFGIGTQEFALETKLWLLKISPELEILLDTTYSVGMIEIISFDGFADSYNNLMIHGSSTTNGFEYHPYIYRLTQAGDSVVYKYFPDPGGEFVFSMIEKPDTSGYYMMISGQYQINTNSFGQILTFDYNLEVTDIDSLPNHLSLYYNSRVINKHQFILTGRKSYPTHPHTDKLAIYKMDTSYLVSKDYFLGPWDTINYPAYLHNLDFLDTNNIYYGGTCNQAIADFSTNKSYYLLGNFDSGINLKWQKYYGGDMYYTLWGLIASSDGGCLLLGSTYNYLTQDMERDILIIKVDAYGVITSSDDKFKAFLHDVIVYPNPGAGYLMVDSGPQITGANMIMTDIHGKQVLNKIIRESRIKVNTELIPSGTYLWQIIYKNHVMETGKWIKL